MNDAKYIGLDVHQATISAVVHDSAGKLLMNSILETKTATLLQFIEGLRGSLHVTLEEGTCAAWLHDVLQPHVREVLVCEFRNNALLKSGNKNDRIDARKLADLLYLNKLQPGEISSAGACGRPWQIWEMRNRVRDERNLSATLGARVSRLSKAIRC